MIIYTNYLLQKEYKTIGIANKSIHRVPADSNSINLRHC